MDEEDWTKISSYWVAFKYGNKINQLEKSQRPYLPANAWAPGEELTLIIDQNKGNFGVSIAG